MSISTAYHRLRNALARETKNASGTKSGPPSSTDYWCADRRIDNMTPSELLKALIKYEDE